MKILLYDYMFSCRQSNFKENSIITSELYCRHPAAENEVCNGIKNELGY